MGNYGETRKQIEKEIKNKDLRSASLELADMIERMSNITSNNYPKGLRTYDEPELKVMLERARKELFREVI